MLTRVAIAICTMRIELTSLVTLRHVDFGEVPLTGDLYVVWGLYKVDPAESTIGHGTGTTACLCTPCDLFTFGVAYRPNRRWGPPVSSHLELSQTR